MPILFKGKKRLFKAQAKKGYQKRAKQSEMRLIMEIYATPPYAWGEFRLK